MRASLTTLRFAFSRAYNWCEWEWQGGFEGVFGGKKGLCRRETSDKEKKLTFEGVL